MTRQAAHYQTVSKRDLSKRQREVLALIAAGKTNGQIAEALGISLDGAKWHVSEILGKVGVSTREEAAEWWLAQRGLRSRVASFVRLFAPLASWKVAAGAAAAAGVAGVVFAMAPDDPRPRPAAPACLAGNVVVETVEAAGPDGAVIFALTVRSASEMFFFGTGAHPPRNAGKPSIWRDSPDVGKLC